MLPVVGWWWLVVGGWVVAVAVVVVSGGWWWIVGGGRVAVVGGWWLVVGGGYWWLVVGGGYWWLVVGGGRWWWLVLVVVMVGSVRGGGRGGMCWLADVDGGCKKPIDRSLGGPAGHDNRGIHLAFAVRVVTGVDAAGVAEPVES